jgi:aspartate--ammonia ligase
MSNLQIPENYKVILDVKRTENAIKLIKDHFQTNLSAELKLRRVTAPLFVLKGTGINDDLNGVERPVSFPIRDMNDAEVEVVQSLAKWKRLMLAELDIETGRGIYTDMNALRPDEELTNIHSVYVDQWDWEKTIKPEDRNLGYLKKTVNEIYTVMRGLEFIIFENFPEIREILPEQITFIHAEELLKKYPGLSPTEREDNITREYGAVFIVGIGHDLSDGSPHDGRAPDYDDWVTPNEEGYRGLNGDIIVWNPVLESALEISSMGIRVNRESLLEQLTIRNLEERKKLFFHQKLINNELPLSIGGGIGQSRLCMFFLRKAHIGEVQASIWPEEMKKKCRENDIYLL